MDVVAKIDEIRKKKGWSVNKLATEAMLTQSTVCNMLNTGNEPKLSTLRTICDAFGMSLAEFFYENDDVTVNPRDLELLLKYNKLPEREQVIIKDLIEILIKK